MASPFLPSLHALQAAEQPLPASTPGLASVRAQVALTRALLDEVDRATGNPADDAQIVEQAIEELARLGCRLIEAAAGMTDAPPRAAMSAA